MKNIFDIFDESNQGHQDTGENNKRFLIQLDPWILRYISRTIA